MFVTSLFRHCSGTVPSAPPRNMGQCEDCAGTLFFNAPLKRTCSGRPGQAKGIHLLTKGFLTDDLVTSEDDGNQKKYLGVCKLPGENRRHRRLDIIVVPYDEYACALVYFTGSAHFNRSLRHLAKKMGMSLSEHSLNVGVVRNGAEKVFEGTPVFTPTEASVLEKLGVPYRPPEERDH